MMHPPEVAGVLSHALRGRRRCRRPHKPKPMNWLKKPVVDAPTAAISHSERLQHLKQLGLLGH
jgi:hypothetical protein